MKPDEINALSDEALIDALIDAAESYGEGRRMGSGLEIRYMKRLLLKRLEERERS